jgi:hypothetical protein
MRVRLFLPALLLPVMALAAATDSQPADSVTPKSGTTLDYALRMGVGGSDNVERTTTDAHDESLAATQLDLNFDTGTRRVKAQATADLTYLKYLQHTYDDDLVGRADGFGRFALVEDRVFWAVQENFGQARVDRLSALTPNNRENINYFSTGPDFAFDIGSTNFLDMNARWSNVNYEVSPYDGDHYSGGLTLGHRLGDKTSLSLNGAFERFKFDDQVTNTDYDRTTAYVRYAAEGRRTTLSANVGVSQVDDGATESSPLVQLEMTRIISAASMLSVVAGVQSTDAAESFRNHDAGAAGGGGMSEPETGTAQAFDRHYYGITWNYERHRSGLDFSWNRYDDKYNDPTSDLDVVRDDFELSLSRQLRANLRLSLLLWLIRLDYPKADFVDNEMRTALGATWGIARSLALVFDLEHVERDPSGSATGFRENRAFISLEYHGK